jgi:hypothetical protein
VLLWVTAAKFEDVFGVNIHRPKSGLMFICTQSDDGIVDILGRFIIGASTCEVRKVGHKISRMCNPFVHSFMFPEISEKFV